MLIKIAGIKEIAGTDGFEGHGVGFGSEINEGVGNVILSERQSS
jgi:hypothetical protein